MKKEKVVLAFSGGLDTSFCVKYLSEEKGYEVHTAIANTGGFSPAELKVIEQKALALGAASHVTLDIEQEYYEKSIKYMVFGNILRNGTLSHFGQLGAYLPGHRHHRVRQEDRRRLCGPRFDGRRQRPGAFRPDVPNPGPRNRHHHPHARHDAHARVRDRLPEKTRLRGRFQEAGILDQQGAVGAPRSAARRRCTPRRRCPRRPTPRR